MKEKIGFVIAAIALGAITNMPYESSIWVTIIIGLGFLYGIELMMNGKIERSKEVEEVPVMSKITAEYNASHKY